MNFQSSLRIYLPLLQHLWHIQTNQKCCIVWKICFKKLTPLSKKIKQQILSRIQQLLSNKDYKKENKAKKKINFLTSDKSVVGFNVLCNISDKD